MKDKNGYKRLIKIVLISINSFIVDDDLLNEDFLD